MKTRGSCRRHGNTRDVRFETLFVPHLDAAFDLARWLSRDADAAEDIVQEACLRAFKSLDGFRGGNARAWLLAIVRNSCYTWFNKRRVETASVRFDEEATLADGDESAEAWAAEKGIDDVLQQRDARRLVNGALAALPAQFREVIVLRELEELSYKEISAILGIALGTVMSRLSRGRRAMLRNLQQARDAADGADPMEKARRRHGAPPRREATKGGLVASGARLGESARSAVRPLSLEKNSLPR